MHTASEPVPPNGRLLIGGVILVRVFVLGGEFWDKRWALSIRRASVRFPARDQSAGN